MKQKLLAQIGGQPLDPAADRRLVDPEQTCDL
jgi:hypothetical protein